MAVVKAKPTSPGRRFVVRGSDASLHKGAPHEPLVGKKTRTGGRNNNGRITTRHRGGGHKQRYRIVDFKRNKDGLEGRVERIEYDPNRSANIALVLYRDGERRYILAPKGIEVGSPIQSGSHAPIKPGNAMPLRNIPVGTLVHCVEMRPGKGGQIARSAGNSVQLVAREGDHATLRLRSGEMRKIHADCRGTIGEVGNMEHNLESLGKAGFDGLFEFTLDSALVGSKKPEARIFEIALERLGLDRKSVWYVGDSVFQCDRCYAIFGDRGAPVSDSGLSRSWLPRNGA